MAGRGFGRLNQGGALGRPAFFVSSRFAFFVEFHLWGFSDKLSDLLKKGMEKTVCQRSMAYGKGIGRSIGIKLVSPLAFHVETSCKRPVIKKLQRRGILVKKRHFSI
jgi:hypothetical protein